MKTKRNEFIVMALLLMLSTVSDSRSQNSKRVDLFRHPGKQWLSWTFGERENFVYGYIQGYGHGMNEACLAADDLFDKNKPQAIGHDNVPSTFPSARCRASVAQYKNVKIDLSTGPDFGSYTTTITEFYTKYPEYRDTPFTHLMELLTGGEKLTANGLYSKLGASGKQKP
jgi:hypothetical protein